MDCAVPLVMVLVEYSCLTNAGEVETIPELSHEVTDRRGHVVVHTQVYSVLQTPSCPL
jgi:hypothetical protein